MTLPPVRLSTTEEKHFSQGYCAFELAANFTEVSWIDAKLLMGVNSRQSHVYFFREIPLFVWYYITVSENLINSLRGSLKVHN